jgi:hypothetical protein
MSKVQCYVSPTQTNLHIVAKLQRLPVAGLVDFLPLSREVDARNDQLTKIRGTAAFLWGDGTRHGESYYFTKGIWNLTLKVNVDFHEDAIEQLDARDGVNFANHMRHTAMEGVGLVSAWDGTQRASAVIQDTIIDAADHNTIAITVDGDGLQSFPARRCWLFEQGANPDDVTALVRVLGDKLLRLDFGGMVELSPDFELVDKTTSLPLLFELKAFAAHFEDVDYRFVKTLDRAGIYPPNQESVNRICSYVTWFYSDLLTAFAQNR